MAHLFKNLHEHIFAPIKNERSNVIRFGDPIDVVVKFIQMNAQMHTDMPVAPYFVASIDGKTSYISTAQPSTRTPVWNELWMIANVPSDAELTVNTYSKGAILDEFIGGFTAKLESGVQLGTLKGLITQDKGSFGYQVAIEPSRNTNQPQYSFDGPIRYSRHFSPTAGAFTSFRSPNGSSSRLWSTWKLALKGVSIHFGNHHQHWNEHYKAAQTIFQGPMSITVRTPIQVGHRLLYARTTTSSFGTITDADSFWALFRAGDDRLPNDPLLLQKRVQEELRIKPAVYTYVIGEDDVFRFSETGASFFVDFASKHALHSCCAESVRYSGEFHPRPVYPDGSGWTSFSESTNDRDVEWELVIDNNSGTYAPEKALLPVLKSLLEYNFVGIKVITYDFKDDEAPLEASRRACREYAQKYRGVNASQQQPTLHHQGTSLFSAACKPMSGIASGILGAAGNLVDQTHGPGSVGGGVAVGAGWQPPNEFPQTSSSLSANSPHTPSHQTPQQHSHASSFPPIPVESQTPAGAHNSASSQDTKLDSGYGVDDGPTDAPPEYSEFDEGENVSRPAPVETRSSEHRPTGW